jgi:hypothetical protein
MRKYNEIPIWENSKRIDFLIKFRNLVVEYFRNVETFSSSGLDIHFFAEPIENDIARQKRSEINENIDKAYAIILAACMQTSITRYPPSAVGGHVIDIDIIASIFDFHNLNLNSDNVVDIIERALGVYKNDRINSFLRTIYPFYWIFLIINYITSLPFVILGQIGFNRGKIEGSFIGKISKAIFNLIIVFAAFLTILEKLGYLDYLKNLILKRK